MGCAAGHTSRQPKNREVRTALCIGAADAEAAPVRGEQELGAPAHHRHVALILEDLSLPPVAPTRRPSCLLGKEGQPRSTENILAWCKI